MLKRMSRFIYREDVPRDIQNIVGEYVQGSRPLYQKWAITLYQNYIKPSIGELADYLDEEKMISRIVSIFVKYYGESIGYILDEAKSGRKNLWDVYAPYNEILSIFSLPNFNITVQEMDTYDDAITFLRSIWSPYHSEFFKLVLGENLGLELDDNFIHYSSEIYDTIEQGYREGLNPSEIDPLYGGTFLTWVLTRNWFFPDKKERQKLETLVLDMLKSSVKYIGHFASTMIKIFSYWAGNERLHGWSNDFIAQIVSMMDVKQFNDSSKFMLLRYLADIKDNELRKYLLNLIVQSDPNFDFNVTLKGSNNILFAPDVVGDPNVLRDYIEYGANVFHRGDRGLTPLEHFTRKGDTRLVVNLLPFQK